MSKLPKISANNSDLLKNALGWINNGNDVYKVTDNEDSENNKISSLPPISNNNTTNKLSSITKNQNVTFHPLIAESKMNDLETKLISLEQTNSILNDRLRSNERNFELQMKSMQQAMMDEKDNRLKFEQLLGMLTDHSSISTNELKNKIHLIQEIIEKEEKWKYEQRQHDIELYKNLIGKLTDKVSETVKLEIDARYKADLDNKALTQNMAQKIFVEMDVVRKEMDELSTDTKADLKENSKECSERAHNLSKYIDMSVTDAVLLPNQNMDKLKNFVSKLADQIKNNMTSQNFQNKLTEDRITSLEIFDQNLKQEIYKFVNEVEERLVRKNKELKNYTDVNIRKNFEILNNRISELSKNTDNNIKIIAGQLIDSRNKLNSKLDLHINENKNQFKFIVEDLDSITNRVYIYEDLLEDYNKLNQATKYKIEKDMSVLESKMEVNIVNERMLHKIEYDQLQGDIDKVSDNLVELGQKIHDDISDLIKNFENNYMSLYERSQLTFDQMNRMAENNIQMFKEFELTVSKIHEETDKIDMNNLMSQMLNKIEEEDVYGEINRCKEMEEYLQQNINNLEEELKKVNTKVKQSEVASDVKGVIGDILNGIETNETVNKQTEIMENLEKNEAVLMDSIKVMERKIEIIRDQEREMDKTIQTITTDVAKIQTEIKENKGLKSPSDAEIDIDQASKEQLESLKQEIEKHKEEITKTNDLLERTIESNQNLFKEIEVKNSVDEMLNKIEFNSIYEQINSQIKTNDQKNEEVLNKLNEMNGSLDKIDKEFSDTNETTKKVLSEYNAVIESKINCSLERLKKENIDMWTNAVELSQKINQPEEIRKIIQQIPPVVIPKEESMRKIYEIEHDNNKLPKPEILKLKEKSATKKDVENSKLNAKEPQDKDSVGDKNLDPDGQSKNISNLNILNKDPNDSNKNIDNLKK